MKKILAITLAVITVCSVFVIHSFAATSTQIWETEPNDTFDTADELDVNSIVSGNSNSPYGWEDPDYFVFHPSKSGKIEITLNCEYNQKTYYLYVYSDSNTELEYWYIDTSDSTRSGPFSKSFPSFGVEAGKTYYIKFYGHSSKDYTLVCKFTENSIIDVADPTIGENIGNAFEGIKNVLGGADWAGTLQTILSQFLSIFKMIVPYFKSFIDVILGAA